MVALFTVLTVAIANLSHRRTQIGELFAVRDLILRSSSRSCPSLLLDFGSAQELRHKQDVSQNLLYLSVFGQN
jgi:hypothetical protein